MQRIQRNQRNHSGYMHRDQNIQTTRQQTTTKQTNKQQKKRSTTTKKYIIIFAMSLNQLPQLAPLACTFYIVSYDAFSI